MRRREALLPPDSTGMTKIGVVAKQGEFQFDLTGGQLALDLANTVSRRDDPERRKDHLASYRDLLAFARQSGIISPRQAGELLSSAEQHGNLARRSFVGSDQAAGGSLPGVFSDCAKQICDGSRSGSDHRLRPQSATASISRAGERRLSLGVASEGGQSTRPDPVADVAGCR